jgi:hypothetical protein
MHLVCTHVLQAAHDAAGVREGALREAVAARQRLEAHVADLESRKRAPLYQKKQEVRSASWMDGWMDVYTGMYYIMCVCVYEWCHL